MTTPAPEQRQVEHMRRLGEPTKAWCGEPMPDKPPTGVADTCIPCLSAVARSRLSDCP